MARSGELFFNREGIELESNVEEEALLEAEGTSRSEGRRRTSLHAVTAVLGAGLLALCAYVAITGLQARQAQEEHHDQAMNMRMLMEDQDFHMVSANALLRADDGWDFDSTRAAVAELTKRRTSNPAVARALEGRAVTPERKAALLHFIRHTTDPAVQEFGKNIGRMLLQSREREEAKSRLQEAADSQKIRALRDSLFPAAASRDTAGASDLKVDPEKMELLHLYDQLHMDTAASSRRLQDDTPTPTTTPSPPDSPTLAPAPTPSPVPTSPPTVVTAAPAPTASPTIATTTTTTTAVPPMKKWWNADTKHKLEEALDILADLVLEADNILSNLDMVGGTFDNNGKIDAGIPYWSKSMLGGASSVLGIGKCFVEADDDRLGEDTGVFSKSNFMLCSMQYAESVADFLSSVDNFMGLSGKSSASQSELAQTTVTTTYWAWGGSR